MKNLNSLQDIIREFFRDPAIKIERNTTAFDIAGWDSMANLKLMFKIEEVFNVKISAGEVILLRNVGDLLDLINKKTSN
jgi:acyl carrier protein